MSHPASAYHRSNCDNTDGVRSGEPFLTDGASPEDLAVMAAGQTLSGVFAALSRHDWQQLDGYAKLAQRAGPTMDPGWYRDHVDDIETNRLLLAATAEYVARLQEICTATRAG